MDQRLKRIVAETERYRITGFLRLPPDGYRSRLSDYLNAPDRSFLPLTDVEVSAARRRQRRCRAVQRSWRCAVSHIVFAMPLDDDDE